MAPLAMEMVRDIDEETVNFGPNYDGRTQEPLVLPSRFPNLLVNGSSGIAVGMATNIPPHNLREVAAAAQWLLGQPGGRARGAPGRPHRDRQGPGLPDRGPHRRSQGHRGRLPHRSWLDHDARRRHGRRGRPRAADPGRDPAAVPGQPRQPAAAHRRARRRRQAHRHRRRARRLVVAHRHAPDHRAQARRRRPGGPQPAVQAHAAAGQLRRQHARARRRRAAHADPRAVHPLLDRPPDRGHPATHAATACARPRSARTSCAATSRPSTPSTTSSRSSARRPRSRTPAPG